MFSKTTVDEIRRIAGEAGIEPAALLAVAEVESGGRAFATVDGRREPLIRFEGHWFDRLLDDACRKRARAEGLASPTPGAVRNPAGQAARWRLVERAAAIDREAAFSSVSWGIGQVMGAHWKALGYQSAGDLAAEARSGVAGQVRLMVRFITMNRLHDPIARHDWAGFARAYNGPGYAKNRYDARIAAAYLKHAGSGSDAGDGPLAQGSRGEAVRDLQVRLASAGYAADPDGIFGPRTRAAVMAFQRESGLAADGIAGPDTMAALGRRPARGCAPRRWWAAWRRRAR